MKNKNKTNHNGVREILLMGVFWRILFIEGVLLVYSLGYRWLTQDATPLELFWYSVRITILVIIIIAFMMITLKTFLAKKIIAPLEIIASSNKKLPEDFSNFDSVILPENSPHEIESIVTSRSKMLKTIFDISEERLKISRELSNELEKGKKIQNDFLPLHLPDVENCEISSYFHSALQLSGDFYDVFELPDNHNGFVIGDVSGKGVGSALFMALTRSLLRIFSQSITLEDCKKCKNNFTNMKKEFLPEDALKAVRLANEYLAKEHNEEGMFVTLFFGVINTLTGKVYFINGGHEPIFVIGKNGIKHSLKATGPALGPIPDAIYKIESIQLQSGDMLFGYTDGVTEARSATKEFYTRARLENIINHGFDGSADNFLKLIKTNLLEFTENAPQSDDITMLTLKWHK
ncbi:PP2C family protein-serine/threonine phosphatase [Desulfobacterales bacterium HSG17]|nr:PP2C family protein-serine/threonine phosphatase [Desulfobacterales bacterium HSG17]